MRENTINQRIAEMINHFTKGNKSAFAKEVGISNQSLGEIVGARQSSPSFTALQKIALAYPSVSLHWLVLGERGMFELTDEDSTHKFEQLADQVEDVVDEMVRSGELPDMHDAPSSNGLWLLRVQEEVERAGLTEAIEKEREAKSMQNKRAQAGKVDSAVDLEKLAQLEVARTSAEAAYVAATRNRIRAERAIFGFNTSSLTAVYKLGEQEDRDALYGGQLAHRLNISNEAAERLVESGKIRATYIDGEGYRVTEQAVRIFLGEF
jgi:excisionase family DNA binding protein